jgi:hypothetical protein
MLPVFFTTVLGPRRAVSSSSPAAFTPADLFANDEVVAWYDPSDLTTMYQDNAGSTPVTAVEQAVGKILDKSGRGNHATQGTAGAKPVLRSRYNLLTYSEQFDNAAWSKRGGAITTNATTAPDGTTTADLFVVDSATTSHDVYQTPTYPTGSATVSFYAKYYNNRWIAINARSGDAINRTTYFDIQNGVVGTVASGITATITSVGNGWYKCSCTNTASVAGSGFALISTATADGTLMTVGDGVSGWYVWGAQFVTAADNATINGEYQRIAAATNYDYDPTKFPPYLDFDGTDDSLATAAIDFSATDAMSAFAGVMKDSDAAQGVIVELTATTASNNGSFSIQAPDANAAATYLYESKGTVLANAQKGTAPAPNTAVLSGLSDISADTCTLRYNGAVAETDTGDQGTGNFANAVMYVARRGGTSLALNGRIYQLVVRGAASSAEEIANTEAYVADKTGVTLP